MKKTLTFAIPSLLAAGMVPLTTLDASSPEGTTDDPSSRNDPLKDIVQDIGDSHTYTLAQHQSHQSHASHRSHRSYSYRLPSPEQSEGVEQAAYSGTRNQMSTPANAILPSSPAIAKKLKVLPGNTARFAELVTRVQLALASRGYEVGEVDGRLHARTIAAVYQYQKDQGQLPSGKLTGDVLSSLSIVAQ